MNKKPSAVSRQPFVAALAAFLLLAPAAWSWNLHIPFLGKKASGEEKTAIAQAFEGKYAVPKTDLPRGMYEQKGAVVDFAELDRLRLMNGAGARAGSALQIVEAKAEGGKVKFLVREPNKRPDPRGLALVFRPAKGEDLAEYLDTERLHGMLSKIFTLSDAPPAQVAQAPSPAAAPPLAPVYASAPTPAPPPALALPDAPKTALEVGMSKKAVLDQLGEPVKRTVDIEGDVVVERLFYEFSDHTSMLLVLRDGAVEAIKRF